MAVVSLVLPNGLHNHAPIAAELFEVQNQDQVAPFCMRNPDDCLNRLAALNLGFHHITKGHGDFTGQVDYTVSVIACGSLGVSREEQRPSSNGQFRATRNETENSVIKAI